MYWTELLCESVYKTHAHLTASFWDNVVKPAPERQNHSEF